MEFYAYHGHFAEEQVVGNQFRVNTCLETDFSQVVKTDELSDAIDYQLVYRIIKEEMDIPSKLLEPLANRIIDRFFKSFPGLIKTSLEIEKMNPPLGGKIESVSIAITKKRKDWKERLA